MATTTPAGDRLPAAKDTAGMLLCIENAIYRRYLEHEFTAMGTPFTSVDKEQLGTVIAESPNGLLLLQSESFEYGLIDLSARLKRIFGDDIKVLLLSADYRTSEDAGHSVDAFLQFPASIDEVLGAVGTLSDRGRKVLLIDDSKLVHNHLGPPLRGEGYQVFDAFDGVEGLELAKQIVPDLIICDIEMPRMNGYDACSAIRKSEGISDTYIIMSSTLGSATDQQQGFKVGVDEYLTKPVVIPELLDRIRKVFKSSSGGRENILVLESDEVVARSVYKSLHKQGFSVRETGTIKATVRQLEKLSYDLVISTMSPRDGSVIELMTALRGLPAERRPDVVIMTSRGNHADEKMVVNAGAAGIITKPFTMDSLLATVERTLADRRAGQERAHLDKYVSKASRKMAIEKSILSGKMAGARAYKKAVTVFFSDIVSFTTRCEKYTPREVVTQVNTLFDVMTRVIMANEGDVDKFMGDACMAFWSDRDLTMTARRAMRAAVEMRRALAAMNAQHPALKDDPIGIRIGLNTGEVILCDLGSAEARMDLSIIGDTVNIAARFESAARQYGVDNLVGEATIAGLLNEFEGRPIDWVRVKGKHEPVACYELMGEKGQLSETEAGLIAEYSRAMALYRSGDFEQALAAFESASAFERVTKEGAINPSRLFMTRCRALIASPPQGTWDGVWTLTSK